MSLDRRQSLAGVPVLHESVAVRQMPNGDLRLTMRVARGTGFFERFRPAVTERSYDLDEFGAFVIQQVDGRRSVQEVIARFEAQYRLAHRECELSVVAFLKLLMQRRVLSVVLSAQGGGTGPWQGLEMGSGRAI